MFGISRVGLMQVSGRGAADRPVVADFSRIEEETSPPPSLLQGAISGAGAALGGACTSFSVGNPPGQDAGFDFTDAEGDVEQPEDVTEYVDVDGDGEPDYEVIDDGGDEFDEVEVVEDGEVPEIADDGEVEVEEDGDVPEVGEDGEVFDPCANAPVISPTTLPIDGAPDVILTPTLDWDASDLDAGDTLTYHVWVWLTSDPSTMLVDEVSLTSQYAIPAGILANNQNYSWQVEVEDSCSQLTSSPIWTFTTEPACAPYSFTDPTDLSLPEDPSAWTYRYEGNVPPGALPGNGEWSQNGVAGTILLGSEGPVTFLNINTLGSNNLRFYWTNRGFDNSRGSVAEIGVRINGQDDCTPPAPTGFQFMLADGVRQTGLTFFPDRVCESTNGLGCYMLDATAFHQYRVEASGDDERIYVDGGLALDGTGMLTAPTTENRLYMGDMPLDADSSEDIDYVYASNLDDRIPYIGSGSYPSAPLDTGADANGHEGSIINWNPASAPGTVSIAVRAADSLADLAAASWSVELTDNPATIPAGVIGRYLQWRVTLNAPVVTPPDPPITPVVDEVTVTRTCP